MEAWSGIDKLKQQLQQNKNENRVKEKQRQNTLENEYNKTIKLLYFKIEELDEKKIQKKVTEYEQVYNELLEITEKQNRLYAEISKYRTITPKEQEKGFL